MAKLSPNHRDVDCTVLTGHFLTRSEAAHRAGMSPPELMRAAGAVRIDTSCGSEEVYPDWQFDPAGGFVHGLPEVVASLSGLVPPANLAGFLLAKQPDLGGASVVGWLNGRPGDIIRVAA